ncbi:hypothetical protein BOTU111921_18150 [Bordetella tumbae]|uniref:hypothetical protein n=1 Tax=Bordetella tumbae TaxID=1649139 RepID=UPI0039EE2061
MTEQQLIATLDLLRQAPESNFPINPAAAIQMNVRRATFDAHYRSWNSLTLDDPEWLTNLGGRAKLPHIRRELRRRGFDIRILEGDTGKDPETGAPYTRQCLTLVHNAVSKEQTTGAVGIDPSEQIARVVQRIESAAQPIQREWGSSTYRHETDIRRPFYGWHSTNFFAKAGACDLEFLKPHFERANYHLVLSSFERILQDGTTYNLEGLDHRLNAQYDTAWARLDTRGALAGKHGPLTENEYHLHRAVRQFKIDQWHELRPRDLERMQRAGMLDSHGWPTDHTVWTDVDSELLAAWRLGWSTAELHTLEKGEQQWAGQTFNGQRRSLPFRMAPMPRM